MPARRTEKARSCCAESGRFLSSLQECNTLESMMPSPESVRGRICGRIYQLPLQPCQKLRVWRHQACDRLVVGIRDCLLSERLQTDASLMLEKAKTVIRLREAVQEQQLILFQGENVDQRSAINYVKGKLFPRHRAAPHRPPALRPSQQVASHRYSSECSQCGKGTHPRHQCPANLKSAQLKIHQWLISVPLTPERRHPG